VAKAEHLHRAPRRALRRPAVRVPVVRPANLGMLHHLYHRRRRHCGIEVPCGEGQPNGAWWNRTAGQVLSACVRCLNTLATIKNSSISRALLLKATYLQSKTWFTVPVENIKLIQN
jgi:hypothetical protein